MKICLVTITDNINIGTALQVYASSQTLRQMGNEVEVVDYIRPRFRLMPLIASTLRTSKKPLAVRILLVLYVLFERRYARRVLNGFMREHVRLTPRRFHSFEALKRHPPSADIYVTGSDQVWNSGYNEGIDRTFYLDFVPDGATRIAYAASFGLVELPEDQLAATRSLISKYSAISVREESALDILQKLGWSGGEHVLDPTLMLTVQEWAQLASPRLFDERYLLIYCVEVERTESVLQNARIIARHLGLKICQVSARGVRARVKGCDKVYYFTSPPDFLSLFLNAEFVVASSFHGTAFSISLNKPFISVMPPRYTARAASLLKILGLEDRMVTNTCDLQKMIAPIDFDRINRQLDTERAKSWSFLSSALGGRMRDRRHNRVAP